MQHAIEARPQSSRRERNPLAGGLILIMLGLVFLAAQTGWFVIYNWWALFILIPAVGNFGNALWLYGRAGRVTHAVRGSFIGGCMIMCLALIFLLDVDLALYWPLFILMPGVALLFGGLPLFGSRPRAAALFAGSWMAFTGLGVTLLALGFLAQNLGWYEPAQVTLRWWALPIFLPALGGLVAGLGLASQGSPLAALASLAAAATVAVVAVVTLLGIDWSLLTPIILVAAGCVLLLGGLGRRPEAE